MVAAGVAPAAGDLALSLWLWVPPVLLIRFAVAAARGWPMAAGIWLVFATPIAAAFSYSVGPYDAQPWWEALSGVLTVAAGLSLLGAAAFSGTSRKPRAAATVPA